MNLFLVWSWSIHIFCISSQLSFYSSTNQLVVIYKTIKELNFHLLRNKVLNHKPVQRAIYPNLLNVVYKQSFFDRNYWSVWLIAALLKGLKCEIHKEDWRISEIKTVGLWVSHSSPPGLEMWNYVMINLLGVTWPTFTRASPALTVMLKIRRTGPGYEVVRDCP
jgi:hypothetical protein